MKIEINQTTLIDQVEDSLLTYFKKNDLRRGDSIPNENNLAAELGVARSVVREALSRLKMMGLIHARPRKGMVLTEPSILGGMKRVIDPRVLSEETILDLLDFRIALEIGISSDIFRKITPKDIEELSEIVKMGIVFENNEYALISESAFHTKLYKITGNKIISEFQEIIHPILVYVKEKFKDYLKPINIEMSKSGKIATHADLLDFIKKGDEKGYRDAIERHFEVYKIFKVNRSQELMAEKESSEKGRRDMKRLHFIILCLSLIILFMNTSCLRKKEKRIEVQWENSLLLPGCAGMPENVGLAGAYSGIVEGKLLVLGGANFPDKYPWEGGTKTWWSTLYSYDLQTGKWTVYDDFLDRPLAYGVSISLPEGLLCIGGCDRTQCSDNVFLIKKEEDSFVIDSVSYPSLPVPLANATGAMGDNCIYIAGGQETMVNEQSTHHFYMLDLMHKERGWQEMPDWNGPSLSYAVGVAQGERFYLFSGRSYAPDEAMVEHTEGYVFEPGIGKWSKMIGSFPVMAGTGIPYGEDKILLFGGVEEILPTSSEHPGFSRKLRVVSTSTNSLVDSLECPYRIPVTTNVVSAGNQVFIVSGEVQPGIRTPFILKGSF